MNKKAKKIAAGEFKSKCLALMDEVQKSKTPLIVTKHGIPVVTIMPFEEENRTFPYGFMRDRMSIVGDIISPIDVKWNAQNDE